MTDGADETREAHGATGRGLDLLITALLVLASSLALVVGASDVRMLVVGNSAEGVVTHCTPNNDGSTECIVSVDSGDEERAGLIALDVDAPSAQAGATVAVRWLDGDPPMIATPAAIRSRLVVVLPLFALAVALLIGRVVRWRRSRKDSDAAVAT